MEIMDMPRNNKGEETIGFGIRLSKSDRQWLEDMALAHGCEVSQLIRHAVETLRQYVRTHKGHLITPIKISSIWQEIDAKKLEALLDEETGLQVKPSAPSPVKQGPKPTQTAPAAASPFGHIIDLPPQHLVAEDPADYQTRNS